jgi:hypothetical protein
MDKETRIRLLIIVSFLSLVIFTGMTLYGYYRQKQRLDLYEQRMREYVECIAQCRDECGEMPLLER